VNLTIEDVLAAIAAAGNPRRKTMSTETEKIKLIVDPQSELESYKQRVRRLAIRVANDEGWCSSGLNDALEELDLAPYAGPFSFHGTVRLTGTVTRVDGDRVYYESPFQLGTISRYVRVASDDSDVRVTNVRVVQYTEDEHGLGHMTFAVELAVRNTLNAATAQVWASQIHFEWAAYYIPLTTDPVPHIIWSDDIDPDEPGNYND
jgi:hypothetical protein